MAQLGIDADEVIALGRTHPEDEERAVRRHPGRAAHEPRRQRREPPSRRGGARDVARAVARACRSRTSRSATSPTACTCRPGSARRCASCSIATSARAGWPAPPSRQTWAAVDQIPDAELWDARWRQRAELVDAVRTAQHERAPAARRRARVRGRARRRRSIPSVLTIGFARRVATYKRLDLLTRDPEWTPTLLGGDQPGAGRAGRQGASARRATAKRVLQRLFGMKRAKIVGAARGVPRRLRPGHGRLARARLRRVAERAPPAARGQRHERDEVGDQRRAAAQRARRLVGGGLRRQERLGHRRRASTTTTRPRTSETPTRCTRLFDEEVLPAFYDRDDARTSPPPGSRGSARR